MLEIINVSQNSDLDFPVDAVITWVDGTDPHWLDIKSHYLPEHEKKMTDTQNSNIRWQSMNELYYCLLGITQYLPWVNQIFIVTMRPQKPTNLHLFPKAKVVYHDEIYPDTSYLPIFNSNSIETQLHNIPDLSEHFIYFNDDFFIGKPLPRSYFFCDEGKTLLYRRPSLSRYMKSTLKLMKEKFDLDVDFSAPPHVTYPLRKSNMELAWRLFPEELEETARSRFRNPKNIWIIGLVFHLCTLISKDTCRRLITDPPDHLYCNMDHMNHLDATEIARFLDMYLERYYTHTPSLACFNNMQVNNQQHRNFFHKFKEIFMNNIKHSNS